MKVYGVFGDPIEHSLSPKMQNAAFQAMGLDACYHAFLVRKSNLHDAIFGAFAMGFGGLNLTIPLKEEALEIAKPDDLSLSIGAINTVVFDDEIRGYNTDGIGAYLALKDAGVDVKGKRALLIGAGGAAKAIAHQLSHEGATITIVNRRPKRALELAKRIGASAYGLDELDRLVPECDLIINATSVGMKEGDSRIVDGNLISPEHVVFDVVYNRETELLKDASRIGAKAVDGVMMLVYQGAYAIMLWTGLNAPVDVMADALREALKR